MLKKALLVMVAVAFLCVPALAGDRPEFDAVCDDTANYFNDAIKDLVVANNPWNLFSDWCTVIGPGGLPVERFEPPVIETNDLFSRLYVGIYPVEKTGGVQMVHCPANGPAVRFGHQHCRLRDKTQFADALWVKPV